MINETGQRSYSRHHIPLLIYPTSPSNVLRFDHHSMIGDAISHDELDDAIRAHRDAVNGQDL